MPLPPILADKHPEALSVFEPSALLREARRQKRLAAANVPSICILDPDGDIVSHLKNSGAAKRINDWPCYHTISTASRSQAEHAALSVVRSAPRSRSWSPKSCLPAAAGS